MSDHGDYEDQQPVHHWCRVCHGPCLAYAGSVHGWTCQGCLRAYLDAGAARADAEEAKRRAKLAAKLSAPAPTTTTSEGGPRRASPHGAPHDREGSGDGYGPAVARTGRGGSSYGPGRAGVREHRYPVTA